MNEIKPSETQVNSINTLFTEISNLKNIKDLEEFNEKIRILNEKTEKTELSTIHKFIIQFYALYNNLAFKEQNNHIKKLIQLSNIMINNFKKPEINIVNVIQCEINQSFTDYFKYNKIFANKYDEKDSLEICFSLCILTKNIKLMNIFFTKYLKVSVFDKDKFNSLNLNNPITATLFNTLFLDIYKEIKTKGKNNLNAIIQKNINDSNISVYNMFRCNKCYSIKQIKLNEEQNFEVKCEYCDKDNKIFTEYELNATIKLNLNCASCKNKLLLYEENCKCNKCKNLFCPICKNKHLEKCFCLNYIKLYEVGYRCELHNIRYIAYCFSCQKNLCSKCKDIHPHKIKEIIDIDKLINDFLKKYKIYQDMKKNEEKEKEEKKEKIEDILIEKNMEITRNLCIIYKDRKNKNLFNGYTFEILCQLLKKDLKYTKEDILFSKFNGEEFRKYYSELYKGIEEGNKYFLNCLDSIKLCYNNKNKKKLEFDYSKFSQREELQQIFIKNCEVTWSILSNLHRFFNYDRIINELKESNIKLKIKTDELFASFLVSQKENEIQQENTHNILCRFLADQLLQTIIIKYHDKLNKISLNLNIFLDIILKSNIDIISNKDILNKICTISTEFSIVVKQLENDPSNAELKKQLFKLIGSQSKIQFIDDIVIGDEIFKKEELNQILDILFFIKNFGSITAHPNINLDNSIKMLNIQKLPLNFEIDYLYNNELKNKLQNEINVNCININAKIDNISLKLLEDEDEIYYQLNKSNDGIQTNIEYDLFKKLENYRKIDKENIINKLKTIRDNLLKNFYICKMKKEAKISEINDIIFNEKDEIIFENSSDFVKLFIMETDSVILKYLNLNLSNELINKNEDINRLKDVLQGISLLFEDFLEFKIPKHNTLNEYIKGIKLNGVVAYDNIIYFINGNLRKRITKEKDLVLDCLKNDIIVEAYFLLLIKTYENEIQYLKSIIKDYEEETIKNIIYEHIELKLNSINDLFQKRFVEKSCTDLTKSIKDNFKIDNFDKISYKLNKIISDPIILDKPVNSKINITSKLFYHQNENS